MSGDRETTSEQSSSIHDGAGYDKVYPLGYRPEEGSSWSSEREPSAHSLVDEEEDYDGEEVEEREVNENGYNEGEGENEGEYEGEDDEDESEGDERALKGGSLGSSRDGHTCPFILPAIWTVNDFKPMMTTNIFKNLRDRYQILDNIPTCLLRKFEKCYSRKTVEIDMYNAMFTTGLRLLLMELQH